MVNSQSMSPDLSTMIQAARNIVFTARRQDQLSCVFYEDNEPLPILDMLSLLVYRSLTVKSVRKQVARDFGLDEAVANREDVKLAIRSAVKEAVVRLFWSLVLLKLLLPRADNDSSGRGTVRVGCG